MVNNSFTNVDHPTASPVSAVVSSTNANANWTGDFSEKLPFGMRAMNVTSICANGPVTSSSGAVNSAMPYAIAEVGATKDQIQVRWPSAVKGEVICTVRADQVALA